MGAVILLVFPVLYAGRTASAVYITLAVLATLTLPAAWCLQGNEFKKDTSTEPVQVVSKKNVFVFGSALVAVFGFYFALGGIWRSEEHTSELQSRFDIVCRLLLEQKKKIK